ncbi:thioredoxin family protein [Aquisphaera insulae]|uniref:thioredoxin family protein n=1 Tax=Aquisphaera insulae TaxID=2712864 RepID=UPI0013ECB387
MTNPRPIPGWTPSTPEISGASIHDLAQRHPALAVHFWAPWNGHDPTMDRNIQPIRERFAGRVHFVSCNIDLAANDELARRCRIRNVPTLVVLVDGDPREPIVGCRGPDTLAAAIEVRLVSSESKRWRPFGTR